MLIVFINPPLYLNRIVMNWKCEAETGCLGPPRTFHLADSVCYWCQYYFVMCVKPAALLYFIIYTCYPAGIVLYYIRLKAEMCPGW